MSALQRLPFIAGITGVGASITALAAIPELRKRLGRTLGIRVPEGFWKAIFILLAILNYKSLPFVWHVSNPMKLTVHSLPALAPRLISIPHFPNVCLMLTEATDPCV
jgi:hypothetical protein